MFSILALAVFGAGSPRLAAETAIPFRYEKDLLWVQVTVPGHPEPLQFLFDTGAGRSVIDLRLAQRLGLELGPAEEVQRVRGTSAAYPVKNFSGRLGEAPLPRSPLALDLRAASRGLSRRVDGLIGADFIRDKITRIDFAEAHSLPAVDAVIPWRAGGAAQVDH